MASQNGGYNAQGQQSYAVTSDISVAGYLPQPYPPTPSGDGIYGGGYSYPQGQYSSTTTHQPPVGAYGAVGDPIAQAESGQEQRRDSFKYGSYPTQFNQAPPVNQEQTQQSWQSYGNNYGDNSGQYGNNYGDNGGYTGAQDNTGGYSNSELYSQDYSQRGRGYYSRGGRGSWGGKGTFRGHRGGNEPFHGHGMGRGTFDSGNESNRGGSWRGSRSRGRGQYEGMRGRGRGKDGMKGRGRGQDGMRGRGRGQRDGVRGKGRGIDQGFNNTNRKSNNEGGNMTQQCSKVALEGDLNFISYKNSLQEYCQKLHKPVPQYTVIKVDVGYSATVVVDGVTYSCQTSQRERKFAEVGAAFEALKCLSFIDAGATFSAKGKKRSIGSNEVASPKTKALKSESSIQLNSFPSFSHKSKLNEVCQKMKINSPSYSSFRTSGGFVCTVSLNGQVYQSTNPFGTKKLAEQDVAQEVLGQLNYQDQTNTNEGENAVITPITNTPTTASDTITLPSIELQAPTTDTPLFPGGLGKTQPAPVPKSMKNILQEYCQKNGMAIPSYSTVKDSGIHISTATVNGVDHVGTPHIMKKTAEQNAAKKAIEELGVK